MSIVAFIVVLHGAALLGTLLCGAIAMFISYPAPAFGYYSYSPVQRSCNSLLDLAVLPFDKPGEYLLLIGAACAVLLVTLILLCSLRQTLGRCRVRTAHVVRLVAYTATPVLVLSSLWIVGVTGLDHALPRDRFGTTWYLPLQLCFLLTPPALLVAYLGIGLKRYLMLPRPWLLAVVTVLVAFLFAATVVVVREVLTHGGYG